MTSQFFVYPVVKRQTMDSKRSLILNQIEKPLHSPRMNRLVLRSVHWVLTSAGRERLQSVLKALRVSLEEVILASLLVLPQPQLHVQVQQWVPPQLL